MYCRLYRGLGSQKTVHGVHTYLSNGVDIGSLFNQENGHINSIIFCSKMKRSLAMLIAYNEMIRTFYRILRETIFLAIYVVCAVHQRGRVK